MVIFGLQIYKFYLKKRTKIFEKFHVTHIPEIYKIFGDVLCKNYTKTPLLLSTFPGSFPVMVLSSTTMVPFTITYGMPVGN